jgi:hypothetical protein
MYSFYNRNAVKRKTSLRNTAEAMDQFLYELIYIFKVRWVASELSALKKIRENYIIIVNNLDSILADADFDAETKALAKGYKKIMLNTHFVGIFYFTMDLLDLLAYESLCLQNREATVVGMEEFHKELRRSIEKRREEDGIWMKIFLAEHYCFKRPTSTTAVKCTSLDLDSKKFKLTEGFLLEPPGASDREFPTLSSIRGTFVDELLKQIENYFPEGSMQMFAVFLPGKLPKITSDVTTYVADVADVALRFGMDPVRCSNEFALLLHSLIDDHFEEYCLHSNKNDPIGFWTHFLNSDTIEFGSDIKSLIRKVLVVPITTAEVERGFSILTHIKYDRRSRLTPKNLRNIMFLRINGPEPENLDAVKYAKKWIESGHMATDDPRQQRKKPKNELPRSNLF